MLDWLKNHVFVAAWLSPLIALIGLIWKKSDPTNPLNWSKLVIYVAFLTALAALITPGLDQSSRGTMGWIVGGGFAFLMFDAYRR